jgi:pilus assembly protein CpaB
MNRTRLLMIGALALALGFFASVTVYKKLQIGSGGSSEPMFDVIVAATDLQVGTKIDEHDIKIVKVPQSALPDGTPRRRSDVIGHGVIIPMTKGEFILSTKLAGDNAGAGLPSLITNGMRAISVRVNEVVSVAGFVTPGTRVDVLLTGTATGSSEPETTTVLQNVLVLASGHTLERTSTGEAQNTAVITLLVTPEDAEKLALASSEGHIQLALRNPLDTRDAEVAAAWARSLYRGGLPAPPAPVVHAPVHHVIEKAPLPPASTGVSVQVYEGDKPAQVVKFPDEGSGAK